jgi:3',5'-cyclic-AMP phosphodiesterase
MLIAQISDTHLCGRGQLYQDLVDSNAMCADAVRHLARLDPQPDLVLHTGDIVDAGTEAEYAMAAELLAPIRPPLLAIPGNHDDRENFRACFGHQPGMSAAGPLHVAAGQYGPVRILGLDITVPGAHHGDMDDACCRWLEDHLAEEPERPTLLMLHQPPFESGIPFIDAYNCRRGKWLASILSRFPAVERVLCGHIHRFMQVRFGGTALVTAPSTTTAIALRLREDAQPASFVETPALLLHHWRPGTGLVTHHVSVGTFRGPLPFF